MKLRFRRPSVFERWLALEASSPEPPLSTTDPRLPVLVVGAGPGGLAGMAALADANIDFVGIESHGQVGGIWDASNPLSSMYEGMRTVTSRQTTYLDAPISDDSPDYMPFGEVHNYFARFAEAKCLIPRIRFRTRFEGARKTERATWRVTLVRCDRDETYEEEFRAVVFATGTHNRGRAKFPEELKRQALESGLEVLHSADYSSPDPFEGKRVLVIGMGNSGTDIADKVSRVAKRTLLAVRTTRWINPQTVFGTPSDKLGADAAWWLPEWYKVGFFHVYRQMVVGSYRSLGLSRPKQSLNSRIPVTDRGIVEAIRTGRVQVRSNVARFEDRVATFVDPRHAPEEIDAVIFATGYCRGYPMLDPPKQPGACLSESLLFQIFHRQEPGLVYLTESAVMRGCWPAFVDQARVIATYFAAERRGGCNVPRFNARRQLPTPNCKGKLFEASDGFHVDYNIYSRVLGELADWLAA